MTVAISTDTFAFDKETEQAAAMISSLGAAVAVGFKTFYEYRPEFSKALVASDGGLKIAGVSVCAQDFERKLFSPSRRVRGDGFYWLDQVMRSAQLLHCGAYSLVGSSCAPFGDICATVREAWEFCAGYGVKLSLKNAVNGAYPNPYDFAEIRNLLPSITAALDMREARRSGYPLSMYVSGAAGSIAEVRLCDFDADGNQKLPGEGTYDFKELFKRLADTGFGGTIIIDADRGCFVDISQLTDSFRFVSAFAEEVFGKK